MKKLIVALLLCLSLCGCNADNQEVENTVDIQSNEQVTSSSVTTTAPVETTIETTVTTSKKEYPNYFELTYDSVKKEYPNVDLDLTNQFLQYKIDNTYGFRIYGYKCDVSYIFNSDGSFNTLGYYIDCSEDLETVYEDVKEKLINEYGNEYEQREVDGHNVMEWNVIPNIEILFSPVSTKENTISLFIAEDTSAQDALNEAKKEIENNSKNEETTTQTEKVVEDVIVNFIGKDVIYKDTDNWIFSDYVTFDFEIINNSSKDIRGISGLATFKDMFGKEIKKVYCDFTDSIPANSSFVDADDKGIEINPYLNDEVKLRDTPFEDIQFEYKIEKIVYEDGTTVEY